MAGDRRAAGPEREAVTKGVAKTKPCNSEPASDPSIMKGATSLSSRKVLSLGAESQADLRRTPPQQDFGHLNRLKT